MKYNKLVLCVLIAALGVLNIASASIYELNRCSTGWKTLSDINVDGGLTVGDKWFDNFSVTTTMECGGSAPSASEIWARGFIYNCNDKTLYGIRFLSEWKVGVGTPFGGIIQSKIGYDITVTDPNQRINGHALRVPGCGYQGWMTWGDGSIDIESTFTSGPSPAPGGPNPLISIGDTSTLWVHKDRSYTKSYDAAAINPPVSSAAVENEITLSGSNAWRCGDNGALLMQFDNIYCQVPEPGTLSLFGVFGGAMVFVRRKLAIVSYRR